MPIDWLPIMAEYVPTGQSSQSAGTVAPTVARNLPALHAVHVMDKSPSTGEPQKPAMHLHLDNESAEPSAGDVACVMLSQFVQTVALIKLYLPEGQFVHAEAPSDALANLPALHAMQLDIQTAPVVGWILPAAQAMQEIEFAAGVWMDPQ